MSDTGPVPIKMILPPDGKQIRIDFSRENSTRKGSPDWWHSISSWFRNEEKDRKPRLENFARKLSEKGYSEKSIRTYTFMMKRFFDHFDHLDPGRITMAEIEDYNFEFFVSGRYSRSYQLQFINAIKLYYLLTEEIRLNLKQLRKSGVGRRKG
ncbi:MAG: phage integrase N-terminal SAM-like domain-containing protein [Bacteroidales bacterium]